jgi:hypothetical protein
VCGRRSFLLIEQQARQVVNYLIVFIILCFRLGGGEKTERLVPVFVFEQVFGFPSQYPDIPMFAGADSAHECASGRMREVVRFFHHEVVSRCRGRATVTRVQIPGLLTKCMRTEVKLRN